MRGRETRHWPPSGWDGTFGIAMSRLTTILRDRFLRFRREILVVGYALRHPETPWTLRLGGLALLVYLVSPVDLVPVFIPFLGVVDDLIIVPWGLSAVVKRLPAASRADSEAFAARFIHRWVARPIRFLVLLVLTLILLWSALLWLLWWLLLA